MPFYFEDETHTALREQARRFARDSIRPNALTWDEAGAFPASLYKNAADAGILGVGFPESLGGKGGDFTHVLVVAEELILEGTSPGVVAGLGSLGISLPPILQFGTKAQQQRWVSPVLRGEKIAALAVTEPGAGSDVANLQTRARRDGDIYRLSGAKMFITSGARAEVITTAVRTGGDGYEGLSLVVVEPPVSGFTVSKRLKKMGWWASDTAELSFDDCPVPVDHRLGEENQGFAAIMANFVSERVGLAGQAVAIAELAYRESVHYAQQRSAFGRPLAGFQVTRHKLADMATRIAAARALTGEVAARAREGAPNPMLAAQAKNAATDAMSWVVDQAVQIHGGYGYMREYVVERLYRDGRILPIGGGTREIMNEVIAKFAGY